MKTSVINVHDMLSVWSADEVEKRIGEVPGVESVTVNFAAESATARYDETRLEVADIKSAVRQRGYESAAPSAEPDTAAPTPPPKPSPSTPAPTPPTPPTPPAPKFAPSASAATPGDHADEAQHDKTPPHTH